MAPIDFGNTLKAAWDKLTGLDEGDPTAASSIPAGIEDESLTDEEREIFYGPQSRPDETTMSDEDWFGDLEDDSLEEELRRIRAENEGRRHEMGIGGDGETDNLDMEGTLKDLENETDRDLRRLRSGLSEEEFAKQEAWENFQKKINETMDSIPPLKWAREALDQQKLRDQREMKAILDNRPSKQAEMDFLVGTDEYEGRELWFSSRELLALVKGFDGITASNLRMLKDSIEDPIELERGGDSREGLSLLMGMPSMGKGDDIAPEVFDKISGQIIYGPTTDVKTNARLLDELEARVVIGTVEVCPESAYENFGCDNMPVTKSKCQIALEGAGTAFDAAKKKCDVLHDTVEDANDFIREKVEGPSWQKILLYGTAGLIGSIGLGFGVVVPLFHMFTNLLVARYAPTLLDPTGRLMQHYMAKGMGLGIFKLYKEINAAIKKGGTPEEIQGRIEKILEKYGKGIPEDKGPDDPEKPEGPKGGDDSGDEPPAPPAENGSKVLTGGKGSEAGLKLGSESGELKLGSKSGGLKLGSESGEPDAEAEPETGLKLGYSGISGDPFTPVAYPQTPHIPLVANVVTGVDRFISGAQALLKGTKTEGAKKTVPVFAGRPINRRQEFVLTDKITEGVDDTVYAKELMNSLPPVMPGIGMPGANGLRGAVEISPLEVFKASPVKVP